MSSKLRLALAGLTTAALIGGVMVADPADAGKKRKHKKVKVVKVKKVKKGNSVKQVSKGGDAKAGNGGNGGAGGSSGNVNNTGNVGGGGFVLQPVPGSNARDCAEAALDDFLGMNPPAVTGATVIAALVPECFPSVSDFAGLQGCVVSESTPGDGAGGLTQAELDACIDAFIPADAPVMVLVPVPGGGSVFSGSGGSGGGGGSGGNATGGDAGNNSNFSSTTVNTDDHSIDVDA